MSLSTLLAQPFIRFLGVGLFNTLLGYALFAAILSTGASTTVAIVVATALGALFNFFSIGIVVFRQSERRLLPRFLGVYVVQCAVNRGLLAALAQAGIGAMLGQLLLLPLLATGTYLAMRRFVFRDAK